MADNEIEKKLKRKITELLTIGEVIKELNLSLNLDVNQIVETFLNSAAGLFLIEKTAFILLEKGSPVYISGGDSAFKDTIEKTEFEKIYPQIKEKENTFGIEEMKEEGIKKGLKELGIELIVPMFLRKELKGIYLVGRKINQESYSEEDWGFLFTFANQIIVIIENATSFRLLQRHVEELTVFNEITAAINSGLDTDTLLDMVLRTLLEMLDAYAGFIVILNKTNREVLFFIQRGLDERKKDVLLAGKNREGIISRILYSSSDKIVFFYPQDFSSQDKEVFNIDTQNMGYWLCRALFIKEETIGIVGLAKRLNEAPREEYMDIFLTFTNQLLMIVLNARLYELSITDGLTGLFVHRYFEQRLREEVSRARRYSSAFSVILMDIDHFKECNDILGHQVGNIILKRISDIIKSSIRKNEDIPARWGGDELAIVLPETGKEGTYILAERIRRMIENYNFPELKGRVKLTISAGICSFPQDALDENELLIKVDVFLYQAKNSGGNKIYPQITTNR